MYYMFSASKEYRISSQRIDLLTSTLYETTKHITYKPCEVLTNDTLPEKLVRKDQSQELLAKLAILQSQLFKNEIIIFRIDTMYRSDVDEDIDVTFSLHNLFYLECVIDGHKIYTNIPNENKLIAIARSCLLHLRNALSVNRDSHFCTSSLPILFTGMASSSLSHELLGHMFEIDNYFSYKYDNVIYRVENLKLTIKDCPKLVPELGVAVKDDALIPTSETIIFDQGHFSGLLIGGSIDKLICTGNLRRERFSVHAIPRLTTLVVESSNIPYQMDESYIRVTGIDRAFIDHKEKRIDLNINSAELVIQGEVVQMLPIVSYSSSIHDLLSKVISIPNQDKKLCTSRCYKKGQVIHCGTFSDDWILPVCGSIWK